MSSNDNQNFIQFYRDNLESSSRYIIIGDMNYSGINWETMTASNANESKFIDFITENALHQHVFEPTRAENILDLVLSSELDFVFEVDVGETFSSSDHCIIAFLATLCFPEKCTVTIPNYHRADWDTIRLYLGAIDWETELRNRDANEMCKKIYNKIYFVIGNFIPKKVVHNQKFAVWDNAEIQSLIRKKKSTGKFFLS